MAKEKVVKKKREPKPVVREFRAYLKTDFGKVCVRKETYVDNDKITADEVKRHLMKTFGYGDHIIVREYSKDDK